MKFGDTRTQQPETALVPEPPLEVRTVFATFCACACLFTAPIVGRARAVRWARAAMWRFAKFRRKGERKWRRTEAPPPP